MDRIIILGDEEELFPLAKCINEKYCNNQADVVMYNDINIGEKTNADKLFLIGHANAQQIGDYDYKDLTIHFGAQLKGAKTIYLSGCSTKSEAAQILKGGFVALSLADNIKKYSGKVVYGTPGVLVLDGDNLYVEVTLVSGYKSNDIFILSKA